MMKEEVLEKADLLFKTETKVETTSPQALQIFKLT